MSYAQGFAQLRAASEEYGWDLPFGEIAKIWRAVALSVHNSYKNYRCI